MSRLINDLLDLSRIKRSDLEFSAVDLIAMVGEIATDLQYQQPERKVELIIPKGKLKAIKDYYLSCWKIYSVSHGSLQKKSLIPKLSSVLLITMAMIYISYVIMAPVLR